MSLSNDDAIAQARLITAQLIRCADDAPKSWTLVDDSNGVKTYSRPATAERMEAFLGVGVVDAPLLAVLGVLGDIHKKATYDDAFSHAEVVEVYTDAVRIERQCYKSPPLVANRDMLLLVNTARTEDGQVVLSGKSTTTPKCPPGVQSYVRAECELGGWLLRPIDATHTEVVFVGSMDLGGSIPAFFKQRLASKQPQLIHTIKPHVAKCQEQLETQPAEKEAVQKLYDSLQVYQRADLLAATA